MLKQMPLSEAALRLGLTYHQVRQQLFRGVLRGGRDGFGRFYVEADAVEALTAPAQPEDPVRTT